MSKTKVIEVFEGTQMIMQIGTDTKGGVDTVAVNADELEELNSDYINEHYGDLQDMAYQRGLEEGKKAFDLLESERNSEYQHGLDDAWEAARKLFSTMAESDIEKAFPIEWNSGGFNALMNLQPQEAIERLKSYEDDKIKRGDIVNVKRICKDDLLGVVTKVCEDNCYIMWGDGSGGAWSKDSVVKTGKHIDVDKFLEEIAT